MKPFRPIPLLAATLLLWGCGSDGGGPPAPGNDAGPGVEGGGGNADSSAGDAGGDATPHADAGDAAATDGGNSTGPDAGCGGPVGGKLQHANPIISRSKPTVASLIGGPPVAGAGSNVVDGVYHSGGWSAGTPSASATSWVAIKLAAGPTRVLVSWDDGGTYNYYEPTAPTTCVAATGAGCVYGLAGDYHIDVSGDSTDGANGTWTTEATVTQNVYRTRAHAIDFTGKSWVKMVITAAPPNAANGVTIGEIDVHDISAAGSCLPDDTWFFMGDSITAFAYDRAQIHQPSFAAGIHTASPSFFPAMINGGIGGELSRDGLARLPKALTDNAAYRFFLLSYGTNDAAGGQLTPTAFGQNMQAMIDMVKAAGRIPVIPHIPFSGDGSHPNIAAYDTVIDTLTQQNQLMAGPDLYAYFMQDQSLFVCGCQGGRTTDNLHPNDQGLAGMNALWTTAMQPLYPQKTSSLARKGTRLRFNRAPSTTMRTRLSVNRAPSTTTRTRLSVNRA